MVSYTTGATALLSLATAVTTTTAINAVERPKNNNNIIHRKLGETEIKTDVTCEQKWKGTPQVCVDVCLEVTSTFKNGKLDSEESMVYHDKCPEIFATRYGGSGGHSGGGHSGGGHSGSGKSGKSGGGSYDDDYYDDYGSSSSWSSSSKDGWKCTPETKVSLFSLSLIIVGW